MKLWASWSLDRGEHIKFERDNNMGDILHRIGDELRDLHVDLCKLSKDERRQYRNELDRILQLAKLNAEL